VGAQIPERAAQEGVLLVSNHPADRPRQEGGEGRSVLWRKGQAGDGVEVVLTAHASLPFARCAGSRILPSRVACLVAGLWAREPALRQRRILCISPAISISDAALRRSLAWRQRSARVSQPGTARFVRKGVARAIRSDGGRKGGREAIVDISRWLNWAGPASRRAEMHPSSTAKLAGERHGV
jgi:hypothetical protein